MNMRSNCLQCHHFGSKCQMSPDNNLYTRCRKYLFPCIFIPSKHAVTGLLPPLALPCPPPPIPTTPSWMHQFAATTNSSNRVRAASIAFFAENGNEFHKARLSDRIQKKQAMQEKFLKVVTGIVDSGCRITIEEINREVIIVFDGMTSYPPPPISPPPNVSVIITK